MLRIEFLIEPCYYTKMAFWNLFQTPIFFLPSG